MLHAREVVLANLMSAAAWMVMYPMQWILVAFDKANSLCCLALLRCSFAEFSGISLFVSFF
jgi:hypothetical protein